MKMTISVEKKDYGSLSKGVRKCFLVLGIYLFAMFYFFFLQKAGNNRFEKMPAGQNFVLLFFCFYLK